MKDSDDSWKKSRMWGYETPHSAQVSLSSRAGDEQRPCRGERVAVPRNNRIQMSDLHSEKKAGNLRSPWGYERSALHSPQVPSFAYIPRSAGAPSLLRTGPPFQGQLLFCCLHPSQAPHGSCHSMSPVLLSCWEAVPTPL